MRLSAMCALLSGAALLVLGCEGSSGADIGASSAEPEQAKAKPSAEPAARDDGKPIEKLPEVDVSALDEFARGIWVDMVNELLSPCGDPVSIARCVAEKRKCSACVPAARYIARLVDDGYSRDEIRELHRLRYDPAAKVKLTAKGRPVFGSPTAPVTVFEFSDFQCPHCRMAAPALKKVVEASNGNVKLVFKQYPLGAHPKARDAARASVAAAKQGKFWEMHDLIFENQERLGVVNFEDLARQLGLDVKRFRVDMKSKAVDAQIDADRAEGKKAGVDSTPSIFVNDHRYVFPPEMLSDYVREESAP